MAGKNILLVEPGYKNKYPPLGLMKIAQYHGPRGKNDKVIFIKGNDPKAYSVAWDRVYITTLFSFEWEKTAETINFILDAVGGDTTKVFVGGISASLMPEAYRKEPGWFGLRVITGLLNTPPAQSLGLSKELGDFYADDTNGIPIEDHIPDYDILNQISYKYPVHDAYFAYASRGCIRKCSFCGVPKLEGGLYDTPSLSFIVKGIEQLYGPKKDLILMDNNVVASPRFKEIMNEIRELGFAAGAKLKRGKTSVKRRVDFNQGVDARILAKDPMFLRELASACIDPLRIAFDHWGLREPYEQSIRFAHKHGLTQLSNYMLYNFHDTPEDLYLRLELNIKLNEELGIRIFSFPMRFQPTDKKERTHIGEKWTKYQLRSFQIILQATHGVVSGAPKFFKHAFGANKNEFLNLLLLPHAFIFHREWYDRQGGRDEKTAFQLLFNKLSLDDKKELAEFLGGTYLLGPGKMQLLCKNDNLKPLIPFYKKIGDELSSSVYKMKKKWAARVSKEMPNLPAEKRVEDAGLDAVKTSDLNLLYA